MSMSEKCKFPSCAYWDWIARGGSLIPQGTSMSRALAADEEKSPRRKTRIRLRKIMSIVEVPKFQIPTMETWKYQIPQRVKSH